MPPPWEAEALAEIWLAVRASATFFPARVMASVLVARTATDWGSSNW